MRSRRDCANIVDCQRVELVHIQNLPALLDVILNATASRDSLQYKGPDNKAFESGHPQTWIFYMCSNPCPWTFSGDPSQIENIKTVDKALMSIYVRLIRQKTGLNPSSENSKP